MNTGRTKGPGAKFKFLPKNRLPPDPRFPLSLMATRTKPRKGASSLLKRKHGWTVLIWIFGTLFPPIAVALRFGIGSDFWLNLLLTICGYIPGHVHNFYIQNIRNNKTHARTPKWAIRYGLVDDKKLRRNAKRSEWQHHYVDRNAEGQLDYDNQPVEEGQIPDAPQPPPKDGANGAAPLWTDGDEQYYNPPSSSRSRPTTLANNNNSNTSLDSGGKSSGRWRYPANFDSVTDVFPDSSSKSKAKSGKKDRWARAEEARMANADDDGKRRKKGSSRRSTVARDDSSSYVNGPNDPVAGSRAGRVTAAANPSRDSLAHEF